MNWQKKLLASVEPKLKKLDVAHRLEHSLRVYKNCELIATRYPTADLDVLYAASLLHDIGYSIQKHGEHSNASIFLTKRIIKRIGFPEKKIPLVLSTIVWHDDYVWVSKHSGKKPRLLEEKIFQDADRLEAIGLIGVIRNFLYAGKHGKKIWDETLPTRPDLIFGGNLSAIHTIRDHESQVYKHLNTPIAKKLAKQKHRHQQLFLKQFFKEWQFIYD